MIIVELTSQTPVEKRYLIAMGAEYTDVDIVSRLVRSAQDMQDRLAPWLADVDRRGSRSQAIVIYFARVKDELNKAGVDWTGTVNATCHQSAKPCLRE